MAKHLVLVHGAWQGAWSFALIVPLLMRSGWTVHAVDLPGSDRTVEQSQVNLERYSQHVQQLIESIAEPVVLLGHSGGGLTISQVAENIPHLIQHLIYLVGMMLPSGMCFVEFKALCQQYYPEEDFAGISPYLSFNAAGQSIVSIAGAKQIFLHDCPPQLADQLAKKLRPQAESGRDLRPILSAQRFGRLPRLYIEALHDRSLSLHMQRLMQALQPDGLQIISMATGHVPQAAQPACLVENINQYFAQHASLSTAAYGVER
jgi:pimeloyl-ACP methyl ester carboxylesterase